MAKIMKNGTVYSVGARGPQGERGPAGPSGASVFFRDVDTDHSGDLRSVFTEAVSGGEEVTFNFYDDELDEFYHKSVTVPSSGGGGGSKPLRSVTSVPQNTDTLTKIYPTGTISIGSTDGLLIHCEGTVDCTIIGESDTVSGACEFDVYVPHSSINQYIWHTATVNVTAKTQGGTVYQCAFNADVRVDDNQSVTGTTIVVMITEETLATKITPTAISVANATDIALKASTSFNEVITVCSETIY